MAKKAIIIGCAGFAGSFLTRFLLERGWQVYGGYNRRKPQFDQHPGFSTLLQDITGPLPSIPSADLLIHTSAVVTGMGASASDFFAVNTHGCVKVAQIARASGCKNLIHLSSTAVYGQVAGGALLESTPVGAPEPYGLSKYLGESVLADCNPNWNTFVLRLPGVLGLGSHCYKSWLSTRIRDAFENKLLLYFNGSGLFNHLIDLQTLADFVAWVTEREFEPGFRVLNFAARQPMVLEQVMAMICRRAGCSTPAREVPNPHAVSSWLGLDRLTNQLGFVPPDTSTILLRFMDQLQAAKARGLDPESINAL